MPIEIKWDDKKEYGTLKKEDIATLQEEAKSATAKWNAGFGEGISKGEKNILKKFDFLELDPENIDKSISEMKTIMLDLKQGKIPKEIMDKLKDSDVVKDLQNKLQTSISELENIKKEYDGYKKSKEINNKISVIANIKDKLEAINIGQVTKLFMADYKVDLDDKNDIQIKLPNGAPLYGTDGKEMNLDQAFTTWAGKNPHLFKGNLSGGSGGGDGGAGGDVSYQDMRNDPKKRSEFIQKQGLDAYKKKVDEHSFIKKNE